MLPAICILETKVMLMMFCILRILSGSLVQTHLRKSSLGSRRSSLGPGSCHIPQPVQWGGCLCVSPCALFVHTVSHPEAAPRPCWVQEEIVIIGADWKTMLHMTSLWKIGNILPTKISSLLWQIRTALCSLTIGLSCVQELWFFLMSKKLLSQHNDGSALELS